MIGRDGEELDPAKLGTLCQERKLRHQKIIKVGINSKLDEIASGFPPEEEARQRPYGVEQEGQAYDVWEKILEKVTDHQDICVLWEVCAMFRSMLKGKYLETRLPQIVKLILEKHPTFLVRSDESLQMRNAKVATFVSLRLLSNRCKESVEHISCYWDCDLTRLFLSTEDVKSICAAETESPSFAVSFFPVNVKVNEDCHEEYMNPAIDEFIELAGNRIKFFECIFDRQSPGEIYDCLRKWAICMPNMERLSFEAFIDSNYGPTPAFEEIEPFPSLPLLQSLNELWGVLPSPYVQRILEASPGISDLGITEVHEVREHSHQMLQTAWETLGNLNCLRTYPYDSLLQNLHLPWKLNKLFFNKINPTFFGGFWDPKATIPMDRLFKFLKQFEDTLEHVEFEKVIVINAKDGFLELKNLKTLTIELHESFENLNFLLYAEKLETLRVEIGNGYAKPLASPREKLDGIIRSSFQGISLWDVFPSLKRFNIIAENYDHCLKYGTDY